MNIELLKKKAAWLRREVFELVAVHKKGHAPSSYSCLDIITTLFYGGHMRVNPKNPKWEDRDRIFISKGHAGMAMYPVLCDLGFVPFEELKKFTKPDGVFRFYPDPSIPGVEAITGSLGHGIGIASGHALAGRHAGKNYRNYVILGDGECYEGSIWESALFAAHHKLNSLVVFVDRNRCCILGHTEDCVQLDPMEDKWRAFGWNAMTIDGHDFAQIEKALQSAYDPSNTRPTAIIANTVKGKGISFMENKPGWHNRMPNDEEIRQARAELDALQTA